MLYTLYRYDQDSGKMVKRCVGYKTKQANIELANDAHFKDGFDVKLFENGVLIYTLGF